MLSPTQAIAILGAEVATGAIAGTTGCPAGGVAGGGFGMLGLGAGVDVGVGWAVGVYKTGVSGLRGLGYNVNVSFGAIQGTVAFGSDGSWIGGSLGATAGLPAGLSVTADGTGMAVVGNGITTTGTCK
jgi:hypothetical protein